MEDIMTFLSTVTLSEYNGNELRNPAALRRHKLAEKIEQQILLAADPNYRPTKVVWNLGEDGVERMFERPKRIKRWWIETVTGRLLLTVRYGSTPLELAKGKNAIELAGKDALEVTLRDLKLAVLAGELDKILVSQVMRNSKKDNNNNSL
jgi:CBS domain-containing protein